MKINLKKALLTGTALVAVAAFAVPSTAHAGNTFDLSINGGAGGVTAPTTGQTVTQQDNTIDSIWDAADGAGDGTNNITFSTPTGDSLLTLEDSTGAGPLLVLGVDVTNDTNLSTIVIDGTSGAVEVDLSGSVTNSSSATNDVAFTLTDGGNSATLNFTGVAAQAVAATIDGNSAGEGTLTVSNSFGGTGVTFADAVGGTNALGTINLNGTNTTVFNSTVDANLIRFTAGGTVNFNGNVNSTDTTGVIDFAGQTGTVVLGDNFNIGGAVDNTGAAGNGTLSLLSAGASTSTIGGNVGATAALNTISIDGNGTDTFSGTVDADLIRFTAAGTVNFAQSVISDGIDFNGLAGVSNFATGANFAGDIIDSTGGNFGTVNFAGNSNVTAVGAETGSLGTPGFGIAAVNINGGGGTTVAVAGTIVATNIGFGGAGLLTAAHNVTTTTLDFGGNNGTLTLASGANFTGNAIDTGGGAGTINLTGNETFTGNLGTAANNLLAINFNGGGGTIATVSGTTDAVTITSGAGTETFTGLVTAGAGGYQAGVGAQTFNGGLTGNMNFAANGTATVGNGQTLTGNVTAGAPGTGTLDVGGAAGSIVTGTVGIVGGNNLLAVNVAGAGVSTFDLGVAATNINILGTGGATFDATTAGTINITGAGSTTTLDGNLTGNIVFGAGASATSDVTLADTVNVSTTIDNTTGTADKGTLTLNGNTGHTITGNVGGNVVGLAGQAHSLHDITINGTGATTNFNGTVNANNIVYGGNSIVNFAHTVTSDAIDFAGLAGTANFADGADYYGDIISTGGPSGTVNFAGTSNVYAIGAETGSLGTLAAPLAAVNANGIAGKTVTVAGTIVATNIGIGAGALTANGNVNGAVNFGLDGTFNVGNGVTVTGAITNTTTGQGTLNLADTGGGTVITGTVGTVGSAGPLKAVNMTSAGGNGTFNSNVSTGTVGLTSANETLRLKANLTTTGAITGGAAADAILISGNDSIITNGGAVTGIANINVATGNTLAFAGGGNVTGGTINLQANNSTLTVSGAKTISSAITGAAGTQTVNATNNVTLSGPITLVEAVTVDAGHTLVLSGGMDVGGAAGTVTMTGAGGSQVTVTSEVNAAINGGAGGDTLAVNAGGKVDGAVTMGAGNDTLSLGGGTLGSTVDMGAGNDTLVLTADSAVLNAITNLETSNLAGHKLTLGAPITGVNAGTLAGFNTNNGTIAFAPGGFVGGDIYDSNGAGHGLLTFTGTNASQFVAGGLVEDVGLTVNQGILGTNGFVFGGGVQKLGAITVGDGVAGHTAVFNVNDNVTSGGALTLANTGTVNIAVDKTLTVASVAAAPAGSTFGFQLNKVAGVDHFGQLVINPAGGNVDLHLSTIAVTQKAGSQPFLGGDLFVLETGAATLNPSLPANPVENSLLYNYVLSNNAGALDMTVTLNPGIITTGNNANVAQVLLVNLNGSANPQIVAIQNNLVAATTAQQVNNDLEATLPTVDGGNMVAAIDMTDATLDISDERLASVRNDNETGMAAGDMSNGMGAWIKGFGQHASQNDRNDVKGYDANTWGGALGLDTANALDHGLVGIDFAYGRSDVNSRNANSTDTNIDSYQATLYGTKDIGQNMFVNGSVAYAWDRNTTVRHNVGGVTGLDANGKYNANQWAARLATGRDFVWEGMTLTPSVVGDYLNFHPQSYTETGAGGADLNVNYGNFNQLDLGGSLKAGWTFKDANGGVTKPDLHVGYRYNVLNDNVQATSSFTAGGGAFTTNGLTPGRSIFDAGADIKFVATTNWNLSASYDFEAKSGYTSHSGVVRAGYKF